MFAKNLPNSYTIEINNQMFVDSRILDDLAETKIQNRAKKLEASVNTIILGTQLNPQDVVRTLKAEESRTDKPGN